MPSCALRGDQKFFVAHGVRFLGSQGLVVSAVRVIFRRCLASLRVSYGRVPQQCPTTTAITRCTTVPSEASGANPPPLQQLVVISHIPKSRSATSRLPDPKDLDVAVAAALARLRRRPVAATARRMSGMAKGRTARSAIDAAHIDEMATNISPTDGLPRSFSRLGQAAAAAAPMHRRSAAARHLPAGRTSPGVLGEVHLRRAGWVVGDRAWNVPVLDHAQLILVIVVAADRQFVNAVAGRCGSAEDDRADRAARRGGVRTPGGHRRRRGARRGSGWTRSCFTASVPLCRSLTLCGEQRAGQPGTGRQSRRIILDYANIDRTVAGLKPPA